MLPGDIPMTPIPCDHAAHPRTAGLPLPDSQRAHHARRTAGCPYTTGTEYPASDCSPADPLSWLHAACPSTTPRHRRRVQELQKPAPDHLKGLCVLHLAISDARHETSPMVHPASSRVDHGDKVITASLGASGDVQGLEPLFRGKVNDHGGKLHDPVIFHAESGSLQVVCHREHRWGAHPLT